MTTDPRAFLAVDRGTATVAVALLGRLDGRWRLLGSTAAPAAIATEPLARLLVTRLTETDAGVARALGLSPTSVADRVVLPRLVSRTVAPPLAAVVAASGRTLTSLAAATGAAGWRVRPLSLDAADPLALGRLLADEAVDGVVAGASDPPGADERSVLAELAVLVGAGAARRPDLTVILAGGLAGEVGRLEAVAGADRPGPTLVAPAADAGEPRGESLRTLLEELRADDDDGRRALVRAIGSLAATMARRIELVEVGHDGALRAVAEDIPGADTVVRAAQSPGASLVPEELSDTVVDGVVGWSTLSFDRQRFRDRLRELRVAPWAEAHGEGAVLRLAAARAAVARLMAATPDIAALPAPDLLVATGGVWASAPGSAVALALADVLRRPGATALAYDHARLLGPLGMVADEHVRRRMLADLHDDLLAPLGSVVMPSGLRAGRTAGRLVVHAAGGTSELDLVPGGLELVDLPPGERAVVEFRFKDPVVLGARARHFAVDLGGGLGGLLVDLRDVPLRLPERPERRRELLSAWQSALWSGLER